MSKKNTKPLNLKVGIIGFGAFGQLAALHLRARHRIVTFDVEPNIARADELGVSVSSFETVASCPIVILSIPVAQMRGVVAALAPLLKPGTLVLDVGSVKMGPARIMEELLPDDVEVAATTRFSGRKAPERVFVVCRLQSARSAADVTGWRRFAGSWG